jgi:hypothetical protein
MFPEFSKTIIKKAFMQANQNADMAVELILSGTVKESEKV